MTKDQHSADSRAIFRRPASITCLSQPCDPNKPAHSIRLVGGLSVGRGIDKDPEPNDGAMVTDRKPSFVDLTPGASSESLTSMRKHSGSLTDLTGGSPSPVAKRRTSKSGTPPPAMLRAPTPELMMIPGSPGRSRASTPREAAVLTPQAGESIVGVLQAQVSEGSKSYKPFLFTKSSIFLKEYRLGTLNRATEEPRAVIDLSGSRVRILHVY